MDEEKANIIRRFEEFGESICGNKHGWKKQFAEKLGIIQQNLTSILNGSAPIGGILQQRLRDLGADVDYIMTGRHKTEEKDDTVIRFHTPKGVAPSDELRARAQRIVQMIMDHPNADSALIERLTKEILSGK